MKMDWQDRNGSCLVRRILRAMGWKRLKSGYWKHERCHDARESTLSALRLTVEDLESR